jgi:hypothetical protein
VILSIPVLLALGGALLFLVRNAGMKLMHAIMGVVLGAQISTTVFAREVGFAVDAVGRLVHAVLS